MDMINVTVDGVNVEVPVGSTALEAAQAANIEIPTLCYLKDINEIGACRMCLVEIEGGRGLQASCVFPLQDGMVIHTNTPAIREARKINLELILSNHDRQCLTCSRNQNCELQRLAINLGVNELEFEGQRVVDRPVDKAGYSIVRDQNKCILCRRCIAACADVQGISVIGATQRGFKTTVEPAFGKMISEVACVNCGQCVQACPVGALRTKVEDIDLVWDALSDKSKHVIVQTAPSVRVALGEPFGMPMGSIVTGKMAEALRRIGFEKVFDTDFAADLTILEEGTELLGRLNDGGTLPMITSCSPGWVKYCEHYFPEFIDNMSSCKSPMSMMSAVAKTYYAEKMGWKPEDIVMVAIMPCSAKKFEASRPELGRDGMLDTDYVLTTNELAMMIKQAGIDFVTLPDGDFDHPLGESTGAGVIFGATGGVMEAALRTVYEVVTKKSLEDLDITAVRGLDGVKEAEIDLDGTIVKAAVAHGTGNAKKLLEKIKNGEAEYHFIEIMGCPGGCVTGGGQPQVPAHIRAKVNPSEVRANAIYQVDKDLPKRKSHENESVNKLYDEFLGKPNSHKAHELLHTTYQQRDQY